jgi:hypothetical protein
VRFGMSGGYIKHQSHSDDVHRCTMGSGQHQASIRTDVQYGALQRPHHRAEDPDGSGNRSGHDWATVERYTETH